MIFDRLKPAIVVGVLMLLTGCVHQEPQYEWVKTNIDSERKEYEVADSQCLAEAYKAAPVETVADADCSNVKEGFSQGFCRGVSAKKSGERAALRTKIYDGCMLGKGWEKQSVK